jgi:CheY-like chemotaxis protein
MTFRRSNANDDRHRERADILIVDDDDATRKTLSRVLAGTGVSLERVGNSAEAPEQPTTRQRHPRDHLSELLDSSRAAVAFSEGGPFAPTSRPRHQLSAPQQMSTRCGRVA